MKSLRSRKSSLITLVDTVVCNLSKGGGVRVEVGAPYQADKTVEQTIGVCQEIIEELCDYAKSPRTPLKFRRIPLVFYRDFLKAELKGAIEGGTF